jgi:membrane protease YdiL (CAAX protease family)
LNQLDVRRIVIFLIVAFGIAWGCALIIYLTGGLVNSPQLIPGTGLTLALVLLAAVYMWAPALANIVTRLVTREGWRETLLRPNFRRGWPYWIAGWFGPAVLTVIGAGLFFVLWPEHFDSGLTRVADLLAQAGVPAAISPWLIIAGQTLLGILIAPLVNGLFTFGEEFGWRGYLQPKLMAMGVRKTFVLMGIIWGVWHWPIIAMGHNYGLEYPGAPWLGPLAMVWFAFVTGTFLGWLSWRGGSIWPAVIGHAALNGIANLGVLFAQGQPNPLLGPLPVGLIASLPWTVLALWILLSPRALAGATPQPAVTRLKSAPN